MNVKGAEGRDSALVRAGAKAIGQWRLENPDAVIAAERLFVANLDLSGADLSAANLAGAHFSRCDFRHASFARANLLAARFEKCLLDDTEFQGANLHGAEITAKSLDGAKFGGSRSLGRLATLHVVDHVLRPIVVDRSALPWFDLWVGWDRIRFLATIRIFVPAYTSLTLTVIYLNGVSLYNLVIGKLNTQLSRAGDPSSFSVLSPVIPTWTHALVLANFACLAVAATCFLGCPARVVEFSRERWLNDLQQPEILYDHATWRKPLLRVFCTGALLAGGLLSLFLLVRGILQQMALIVGNIG